MNNAEFEKIAKQLATCAVTRDTKALGHIKQAAGFDLSSIGQYLNTPGGRYALGGLGGAGLGALVGAMQPKRKGRNALYYGALGGLGGLGLAHLYNSAGGGAPAAPQTEKPKTEAPKPDGAQPAAKPVAKPLPEGPVNVDVPLTPETATPEKLRSQHGGEGQYAHVPVKPRFIPTDEQAEWRARQDLGPSHNRGGVFVSDLNEQYQNWRRDPNSISWLTRLRFGREFEERAARERDATHGAEATRLRQMLPPPAIPVREDGTPTGHVVPTSRTTQEHDIYAPFQIPNADGTPSGKYRDGALELIQKARYWGFGESPERIKEFQRGLSEGYSPWFLWLSDKTMARPGDADYGDMSMMPGM